MPVVYIFHDYWQPHSCIDYMFCRSYRVLLKPIKIDNIMKNLIKNLRIRISQSHEGYDQMR